MTFDDIKRNIGKRLGDPDLKKYRGLVGDMFVNAMCDLIAADRYQPEDIPDLIVDKAPNDTVDFENWEASYTLAADTLKFLDVYLPTAALLSGSLTLKEVTHAEIKRIRLEPAFAPTYNECFWYRKGSTIRFVLSRDFPVGDQPNNVSFIYHYIKNPVPADWQAHDMIKDLGYSRDFLYACIKQAVEMLKGSP